MQLIDLSRRQHEVDRLEQIAANHPDPRVHAIGTIISPLAEAIARHSDIPYVLRRQGGPLTRQYKVQIGGNWYVFRYDHRVHAIRVKQRSQFGRPVRTIDATTSTREIDSIIAGFDAAGGSPASP